MSRGRKILYWIITGVVLSAAVSSMILTRNGRLMQFYDDGYVKDLKDGWQAVTFSLGQYDGQDRAHLNLGESTPSVFGYYEDGKVHCLQIDVSDWNGTEAEWVISYQDGTGVFFYEDRYEFQQGKMKIPILNLGYTRFFISLYTEGNLQYQLKRMLLSEYEELLEKPKWLLGIVICFLGYLLISAPLYVMLQKRLRKRNGKQEKNVHKFFLEEQADIVLKHLNWSESGESYAPQIRIVLMILFVINGRTIHYNYGFRYAVAIAVILLLALTAWIPIREAEERKRHIIWQVWLLMCGMQLISNLLLKKSFGYGEYIEIWMILCCTLLYRAWGRMKEPEKLLDDLFRAVEILTGMISLFCLFGDARKNYAGRLSGVRDNQNPFALGITVCLVFMFFRLFQVIRQKKKWYFYLEPCIGLVLCFWMIYQTQTRNAWAIAVLVTFVFLCFVGSHIWRHLSRGRRRCVLIVISISFFTAILLLLKNGMIFSNRTFVTNSINMILSGRPEIWKMYLEKVNILGCVDNLRSVNSGKLTAHNGIIMEMYRYGVLAGILRIVFLVEVLCTIYRIWKKKSVNEYVFLVIGVFIAYFIASMLDTCDERTSGRLEWTAFYMIVGYIIQEDRLELPDYEER